MSATHVIDNPLFKTLQSMRHSVDAICYLAQNTPIDDSDFGIKKILSSKLRSEYDELYVQTIKQISN